MRQSSVRQNYTVRFRAMGTQIQAWLTVTDDRQAELLQQVPDWFEAWEARFSRFRPESELSQVNGYAGQWIAIAAEMSEVIGLAIEAAAATDGLFSPLILPALIAAGYDRSFDQLTDADHDRLAVESVVGDWRSIDHDGLRKRVYLPPGAALDLGGIVKGWAAQQAADRLAALIPGGACLVDAGGDMAAHGSPDESAGWQIGLPRTRDGAEIIATIVLTDNAIATSGVDHRHWIQRNQAQHHLIDPRTGRPAASDARSATVIAPNGVLAEVWAKATLIAGTCALAQHAGIAALIVRRDLSLNTNSLFEAQCLPASLPSPTQSTTPPR